VFVCKRKRGIYKLLIEHCSVSNNNDSYGTIGHIGEISGMLSIDLLEHVFVSLLTLVVVLVIMFIVTKYLGLVHY
jgi:hypothetical protein